MLVCWLLCTLRLWMRKLLSATPLASAHSLTTLARHVSLFCRYGNDVLHGGDAPLLTAVMDGPDPMVMSIEDLHDGGYALPYIAPIAGAYTITLDLMDPGFMVGTLFSKADLLDPLVSRLDTGTEQQGRVTNGYMNSHLVSRSASLLRSFPRD